MDMSEYIENQLNRKYLKVLEQNENFCFIFAAGTKVYCVVYTGLVYSVNLILKLMSKEMNDSVPRETIKVYHVSGSLTLKDGFMYEYLSVIFVGKGQNVSDQLFRHLESLPASSNFELEMLVRDINYEKYGV